jgi:type II secretory pathway component PulJ
MMPSRRSRFRRTAGFTMLEIMVASLVMTLLVVLLSQVWVGMIRPTTDMICCSQLDQEAKLAAAALAADLGGSLANPEGRLGTQPQYKYVGRLEPANSQLWLCFDGGSSPNGVADWGPPDSVIVYEVQDGSLVRFDQTAGTSVPIARHVDSFATQDLGDGRVQLQLVLSYRNVTRTYTFIGRDP